MEDTQLFELIPLLKELVLKEVKDVRHALTRYRDQMLRKIIVKSNADSIKFE